MYKYQRQCKMTLLKCGNCIFIIQGAISHYARKHLYLIYPWNTMTYLHSWKFEETFVSSYLHSHISIIQSPTIITSLVLLHVLVLATCVKYISSKILSYIFWNLERKFTKLHLTKRCLCLKTGTVWKILQYK